MAVNFAGNDLIRLSVLRPNRALQLALAVKSFSLGKKVI